MVRVWCDSYNCHFCTFQLCPLLRCTFGASNQVRQCSIKFIYVHMQFWQICLLLCGKLIRVRYNKQVLWHLTRMKTVTSRLMFWFDVNIAITSSFVNCITVIMSLKNTQRTNDLLNQVMWNANVILCPM